MPSGPHSPLGGVLNADPPEFGRMAYVILVANKVSLFNAIYVDCAASDSASRLEIRM
jgi:hypothetical protein